MKLIYEGSDITKDVDINTANIYDRSGGKADSLTLIMADTISLWSKWKPTKGDRLRLQSKGFDSGIMYLDEWEQDPGIITLRAISTPLKAKTEKTRTWRNIRLLKVAQDITANYGLTLKTYNITNYLYDHIDQVKETDFGFLNRLCIREGYALKITNQMAIIYDERIIEKSDPVMTIEKPEKYNFNSVSDGLKSGCIIKYLTNSGSTIEYKFNDPRVAGGTLKINEYLGSQAEAERFSKGYLRALNKYETTGVVMLPYNEKIAGGNTVNITGIGLSNGRYFVDMAKHRLADGETDIYLRWPLEGY